jgi:hypothetical protein
MAYFPTSLGNPNTPSLEGYPGWQGFRSALNTYFQQAAGEEQNAQGQIAGAAASDPVAQNYQANTGQIGGWGGAGRGQEAATGLYSGLMGAQDTAGVNASDVARTTALGNVGNTELGAASNVYSQQMANEKFKNAQSKQATDLLSLVLNIPKMLGPQGEGGQIFQAFGGGPGSSPLGSLGQGGQGMFSGLMSLFGGDTGAVGTGASALPAAASGGAASLIPDTAAGTAAVGAGADAAGGAAAAGGTAAAAGGSDLFASLMSLLPLAAAA